MYQEAALGASVNSVWVVLPPGSSRGNTRPHTAICASTWPRPPNQGTVVWDLGHVRAKASSGFITPAPNMSHQQGREHVMVPGWCATRTACRWRWRFVSVIVFDRALPRFEHYEPSPVTSHRTSAQVSPSQVYDCHNNRFSIMVVVYWEVRVALAGFNQDRISIGWTLRRRDRHHGH